MADDSYMCPVHKVQDYHCCDRAKPITGDEDVNKTTDQLSEAQGAQWRWNRPQDNN